MICFSTSITYALDSEGVGEEFLRDLLTVAQEYEGISDLLMMWADQKIADERKEIMDAIREVVKECLDLNTDSPERTCDGCGDTGAMRDKYFTWRCRYCDSQWASSAWQQMPTGFNPSSPEKNLEWILRMQGFAPDYIKRLIFHARKNDAIRDLLERWKQEESLEEQRKALRAIDDLLKARRNQQRPYN